MRKKGFLPDDKTRPPLQTWEKDRHTPHFGEEGIGLIQSARRSEATVKKAAARSGNRHKQGDTGCDD
jgi:hypothetical protein